MLLLENFGYYSYDSKHREVLEKKVSLEKKVEFHLLESL